MDVRNEFYKIADKIDTILKRDSPSLDSKNLFDLISHKTYEDYFFRNVKSIKWFYPLKEKDYFKPNVNMKPQKVPKKGYYIPRWNVLNYLETISELLKDNNVDLINELLNIIRIMTNFKDEKGQHIDNYLIWWYFVKILLNIPNNKIPFNIVELISIWLDSKFNNTLVGSDIATKLLPKFLNSDDPEDWKKAEKIVDTITSIKWIPLSEERAAVLGKKYEPKTIIDSYWLLNSFESNSKKIGEKCSENIVFLLANRLKEILKREYKEKETDIELFHDYSDIWFKSISLGSDIGVTGVEETFTLILRYIILSKAREDKEVGMRIFKEFLSEKYKYPIYKRLVIFTIGSEWEAYKILFWEILRKGGSLIFDYYYFFPEIYELLENNVNRFSEAEKERIKKIIEEGPPQLYLPDKNRDAYIANWKQEWYSAVKQDTYFKALYDGQKEITEKEEEISFKKPTGTWVGPGPSPLSKEEILEMQNEELATYINSFKPEYLWKGSTIRGLADALRDTVREKPEKFIDDPNHFLNVGYLYIDHIFWGIQDAWNNKKKINWGKLFEFIKKYIDRDSFWNDEYIVEGDDIPVTHSWVTGIIGKLIQDGTKDDSWAFSEEYFDIAIEILSLILEKEKIKEEKISDFVTHALNSCFGKVITALIYLALRIARVQDKKGYKEEIKWDSKIKEKYDKALQDEIIESYTLLGRYMSDLFYLDKNWVKEKINIISFSENKILWESFIDGYLFNRRVYENLYKLMRQHYELAIGYDFRGKHTMERLIRHISVGYLYRHEKLDFEKSLFYKILNKCDYSQIKEVIRLFWMQKKYIAKPKFEEIKSKIIKFWKWVYENKYKKKKSEEISDEDKKILSNLSLLTIFIDKIGSENINLIKLSARFVNEDYKSPYFIKYLDELKDKDKRGYVGDIFLEILEDFIPTYDKTLTYVKSIVEYLYKNNFKVHANKISNIYGSKGYEFLRDLYNKYN